MIKKFGIGLSGVLILSACNLYGGLDKPGSDPQYLIAARACLDRGDYACAKENYQALSSAFNDVKVSETGLTTLAENNIFSISDLVSSLGSNLGGAASFSILAEALASRGITAGTYRTTLKTVYDNNAAIGEANLRAFSRFIAALGMFNEVLANAVGADGKLTAGDIVNPSTLAACRAGGTAPGNPSGCVLNAVNCAAPSGTALTYDGADAASMSTVGSDWSGPATIQKMIRAASAASTELSVFANASSNDGLLSTINQLATISGGEACTRFLLIQFLNL